jgi:hypothetical protein
VLATVGNSRTHFLGNFSLKSYFGFRLPVPARQTGQAKFSAVSNFRRRYVPQSTPSHPDPRYLLAGVEDVV